MENKKTLIIVEPGPGKIPAGIISEHFFGAPDGCTVIMIDDLQDAAEFIGNIKGNYNPHVDSNEKWPDPPKFDDVTMPIKNTYKDVVPLKDVVVDDLLKHPFDKFINKKQKKRR